MAWVLKTFQSFYQQTDSLDGKKRFCEEIRFQSQICEFWVDLKLLANFQCPIFWFFLSSPIVKRKFRAKHLEQLLIKPIKKTNFRKRKVWENGQETFRQEPFPWDISVELQLVTRVASAIFAQKRASPNSLLMQSFTWPFFYVSFHERYHRRVVGNLSLSMLFLLPLWKFHELVDKRKCIFRILQIVRICVWHRYILRFLCACCYFHYEYFSSRLYSSIHFEPEKKKKTVHSK